MPPADATAGQPDAAARLRAASNRLATVALEATFQADPTFPERYDERMLRILLRDYERHIEQLARALETGEDRFVVQYGEWLVPVYRHRRISMRDFVTMLEGLGSASIGVLGTSDGRLLRELIDRWAARLRHHQRLAGDHKGNSLVRFFWKGAGIGDDSVI
ncbi:MAG: hypothetical protein QOH61_290 [Chloroflexota bacterium]|jgi:hypothetical protein|nr:hypothetical protein [Chloroflexota bacterium]